jgi:hypothetical protein
MSILKGSSDELEQNFQAYTAKLGKALDEAAVYSYQKSLEGKNCLDKDPQSLEYIVKRIHANHTIDIAQPIGCMPYLRLGGFDRVRISPLTAESIIHFYQTGAEAIA